MSADKKLKPCPFCGGTDLSASAQSIVGAVYRFVRCNTCYAQGPGKPDSDDAREAWNIKK